MSYDSRPEKRCTGQRAWDYAVKKRGREPITLSYSRKEHIWIAFYPSGTTYGPWGGMSACNDLEFHTDQID